MRSSRDASKASAILDEESLLATCTYIDLNPVAAGIVEIPEASLHTSIAKRVEHVKAQGRTADVQAAEHGTTMGSTASACLEESIWLCAIEDRRKVDSSREGMLEGFSLGSYLLLAPPHAWASPNPRHVRRSPRSITAASPHSSTPRSTLADRTHGRPSRSYLVYLSQNPQIYSAQMTHFRYRREGRPRVAGQSGYLGRMPRCPLFQSTGGETVLQRSRYTQELMFDSGGRTTRRTWRSWQIELASLGRGQQAGRSCSASGAGARDKLGAATSPCWRC